jgi:hypothetical protein
MYALELEDFTQIQVELIFSFKTKKNGHHTFNGFLPIALPQLVVPNSVYNNKGLEGDG